jgi:predicted RNA-binding protein Jag
MSDDTALLDPRETLDSMLGLLGFITEIKEFPHEDGTCTLQVYTGEKDRLIGRNGETLDDLQLPSTASSRRKTRTHARFRWTSSIGAK